MKNIELENVLNVLNPKITIRKWGNQVQSGALQSMKLLSTSNSISLFQLMQQQQKTHWWTALDWHRLCESQFESGLDEYMHTQLSAKQEQKRATLAKAFEINT